jgi:predicted RNA binding protein YcfA (HicA-like mRNA interferase family)
VGGSGSHQQFKHPSKPGRVTIVFHGAATLKADTFKRIIQQAGPTVDQFVALL